MKVSYQWLQEYFEKPLPAPEELSQTLIFHAFEIESVEKVGEDSVFDVKITPNRGADGFSHRGIAKEISVILNQPLFRDSLRNKPDFSKKSQLLSVEIKDPILCRRYCASVIKRVRVGESPEWLKRSLESVGQRSINNVVDATNFVMFNLGQPLHAFDARKLSSSGGWKIEVRSAQEGENITTLDNKEYSLNPAHLLIVDAQNNSPIGIAGVKGGKAAEVNSSTEDIVIESANFEGVSIRKTSQFLKLRTDASARFEHKLSPELAGYALREVVDLIVKIAGGEVEGYIDQYPSPFTQNPVHVSLFEVNKLLGLSLSSREVRDIFDRFGFLYTEQDGVFSVTPPFERLDLFVAEDLIEEVGRVYGYQHIAAKVPEPKGSKEINKRFFYSEKIREFLVGEGFSEVLTSSFGNSGEVEMLNALASDKGWLRKNLRTNLDEALTRNVYNQDLLGLNVIKIFEIGTVFKKEGEHTALAWAMRSGDKKVEKSSLVELEKVLTDLEKELGISISVEKNNGVFETNLDVLIESLSTPLSYESHPETSKIAYRPFSVYPVVLRDIAVFVPVGVSPEAVFTHIQEKAGDLFVRSRIFDIYEKEGQVSYAFRLVFQSTEKTLSDEEVNAVMVRVTETLNSQSGWKVR